MSENPYEPPKTSGKIANGDDARGPWWSRPWLIIILPLAVIAIIVGTIAGAGIAMQIARTYPEWFPIPARWHAEEIDDPEHLRDLQIKASTGFVIRGAAVGFYVGLAVATGLLAWYFGAMIYRMIQKRKTEDTPSV